MTEKEFREKALRVQTQTIDARERKRTRGSDGPGTPGKRPKVDEEKGPGNPYNDSAPAPSTTTTTQGGRGDLNRSRREEGGRGPRPYPRTPQGPPTETVKCFACGAAGHIAPHCPNSSGPHATICYHCRKEGHIARNCPSKEGSQQPATGSNNVPVPARAGETAATGGGGAQQ